MTRYEIHAWQAEVNTIIATLNALGDKMEVNNDVMVSEYNELCQAIASLEKVADTLSELEERQSKQLKS
jgi:uncharacterized protein YaaN involved in tellurite resistance